jgi:hypothetical protein
MNTLIVVKNHYSYGKLTTKHALLVHVVNNVEKMNPCSKCSSSHHDLCSRMFQTD